MFLKKKKKVKVESEQDEMATPSQKGESPIKKQRPGQKGSGKLNVGIGSNEAGDVDDV